MEHSERLFALLKLQAERAAFAQAGEPHGPRVFTFFLYLNDVPAGGGGSTWFPSADVSTSDSELIQRGPDTFREGTPLPLTYGLSGFYSHYNEQRACERARGIDRGPLKAAEVVRAKAGASPGYSAMSVKELRAAAADLAVEVVPVCPFGLHDRIARVPPGAPHLNRRGVAHRG